jgi:nitroreductase
MQHYTATNPELAAEMEDKFEIVAETIRTRRTIKPGQMNGRQIPDEQIQQLIELANWAPTHGNTEPWKFFIYAGNEKVRLFCRDHANLYQQSAGDNPDPSTIEKILHMGDQASHLIIAVMQRGKLSKIPVLEEIAATSAAIQNLLLGAHALGLAAYWGSGGMVYRPQMKDFLGLGEEDVVLGALYLGYSDIVKSGVRQIPVSEKVKWM